MARRFFRPPHGDYGARERSWFCRVVPASTSGPEIDRTMTPLSAYKTPPEVFPLSMFLASPCAQVGYGAVFLSFIRLSASGVKSASWRIDPAGFSGLCQLESSILLSCRSSTIFPLERRTRPALSLPPSVSYFKPAPLRWRPRLVLSPDLLPRFPLHCLGPCFKNFLYPMHAFFYPPASFHGGIAQERRNLQPAGPSTKKQPFMQFSSSKVDQ